MKEVINTTEVMKDFIIVEGEIVQGLQIASGIKVNPRTGHTNTIAKQKPFFIENEIPMEHIFNGTINMDVSPYNLRILKPDYEVKCTWDKDTTETFWLVNTFIEFEGKNYGGFIYYPCPSKWKAHKDNLVEILCEKVPDIKYGKPIAIQAEKNKIELY